MSALRVAGRDVIVALFALINIAGLVKIIDVLGARRSGLAIESFSPGSVAPPESDVLVGFSQPMVAEGDVGSIADAALVSLSPSLRGRLTWLGTRTLRFAPEGPLPMATPYRVTVSGKAHDLAGRALGKDATFEFATPALALVSVRQVELNAGRRARLAFEFNEQVSPQEFMGHLALKGGDGRTLGCTLETPAPARVMHVRTAPLEKDALTATIGKGLRSLVGPLGIEADVAQALTVDLTLRVETVEGYSPSPDDVHVSVRCTQPVDVKTAAECIRVEPEVKFTVSNEYNGFQLNGPFRPGERYRIRFLQGLRGENGTSLTADLTRTVVTPDLSPRVRFRSSGIYLASQGSLVVPLETVNLAKVTLNIEKVYDNNIVHYMRELNGENSPRNRAWAEDERGYAHDGKSPPESMGRTVYEKDLVTAAERNKTAEKPLDLRELIGPDPRGVFMLSAGDPETYWTRDRQLVMVTDLGLSAKCSPNDMLVWVRSLATTGGVEGATVRVCTRANQEVLKGTTDADGVAHFKDVDWSGDRQPYAVVASKDGDQAFIGLDDGAVDFSAFDTGGRPWLRKGYEAFVFADRGIYRPGETVHLHGIVRSPGPATPAGFPVKVKITRPDGREFRTVSAKLSGWGSVDAAVSVPAYAPTGQYKAEMQLPDGGQALGEESFLVEEFIPDRMKAEADAPERRYRADEEVPFTVRASHLFGAPAAGRRVSAECWLESADFLPKGYEEYVFGDPEAEFARVKLALDEGVLDDKGEKVFTVKLPKETTPPKALEAVFTASVKEVGGRAVTAMAWRTVDPYPLYVGLKRARSGHADPGQAEAVRCVLVRPDGSSAPDGALEATVSKISRRWILKYDEHNRYRYESEREEQQVAQVPCAVSGGAGEVRFTPESAGEYRIVVRDPSGGARSAIGFYCGGGDGAWSLERPDRLDLTPDKPAYAPGETAGVLLRSPFKGPALFTVESDRIHLVQTVELDANTHVFRFPVDESWGPNVYCTATVIRPPQSGNAHAARRAVGTVALSLDRTPRRLAVDLDAPETIRPKQKLHLAVTVTDAQGRGPPCEVTLAAVDEGVCRLTQFATPDPWAFFYGKRRLDVATSDVYSLLMPEYKKPTAGADSEEGGDGGGGYDPRLLNPVHVERVKPAAVWMGSMTTSPDGRAEADFDVPEFFGELRLMAVAAGAAEFGCGEKAVKVRQPLMVQASFPRFLAPGDAFDVPVTVFNHTAESGEATVGIDGSPSLGFGEDKSKRGPLTPGGEATVTFHVTAPAEPGAVSLRAGALLGTEEASEAADIPVRPGTSLRTESGWGAVSAGTTGTLTLPGGFMAGTDTYRLTFSGLPTLKLAGSLRYLMHYPYGCVEQTTSCVFPLLYLSDIAAVADPETFRKEEVAVFVQAGIDRLFSMQTYQGGFDWWPGGQQPYPWGSAYATHFLVEAREAGYDVPKDMLDRALVYLESLLVNKSHYEDAGDAVKAYACMVLARAGRPDRSSTMGLAERSAEMPAYSRFMVASALALMKERGLAREAMQMQTLPESSAAREMGGSLSSPVRETAILLSTYLDAEPDHPYVAMLAKRLEASMEGGRWLTTQENSFAMLALGKYLKRLQLQETNWQAEVRDGETVLATLTSKDNVTLKPEAAGGKEFRVAVTGKGTLYYQWCAEGVPIRSEAKDEDNGLAVRRRYLDREGQEITPLRVRQGDVVVVEITVKNPDPLENVAVSDLLPAGLEIEDPRIATREDVAGEDKNCFTPDHVEMRDDRLLLFANFPATGEHHYRYAARAVTCGHFQVPPITAQCMYSPDKRSESGAGEGVVF